MPYAAGGLTDSNARQYCEFLSRKFGQNFIVDNRPGAGGQLGVDIVCKSAPDGYTLLATTLSSVWTSRALYNKLPFDADRDLAPITLFPSGALIMASPASVPVTNANEMLEYAKKNPVNFGSYGIASWPHMIAENWTHHRKVPVTPVHYKGESLMWLDIISGQLQTAIGSYLQFAIAQSKGAVKAIGVTGSVRSPKLPDVPTLVEQGFKDPIYGLEGWMPMAAPAGTPVDILKKIADAVLEASGTDKLKMVREQYSIGTLPTGYDETQRRWKAESQVWAGIAAELNIKLD
jgi:tripartite-type tricarboxylate transporter receptor subunit TctC